MACPYFLPTEKADHIAWLHPSRLPLGTGWAGHCCAPGHEGATPALEEIRDHCNLGYATACVRLPDDRDCDAIRFSVTRDSGLKIILSLVKESGHRPAGHGTMEYDATTSKWNFPHPESRIQKMAECYLQSYLNKKSASHSSDCMPDSSQNCDTTSN